MWRPSGWLPNPESCRYSLLATRYSLFAFWSALRLMQIITDIIEYLDERGLLSAADMAYLRQHGFIPTPEEPEHPDRAASKIDHRQAAIAFCHCCHTARMLADTAAAVSPVRGARPLPEERRRKARRSTSASISSSRFSIAAWR